MDTIHLSAMRDIGLTLCDLAASGDMAQVEAIVRGQSPLRQRFLARLAGCVAAHHGGAPRLLAALAGMDHGDVKAEAYDALGRCPASAVLEVIGPIAKTREQDSWVEVSRIRVLGHVACMRPVFIAQALATAARTTHRWVQVEVWQVLDYCWRADDANTFQEVAQWLRDPHADVRETALRWMGMLNSPPAERIVPLAIASARDPAPLVREAAVRVLSVHALHDPDRVIPALRELARERTYRSIRLALCRGLSRWQKGAPLEALEILRTLFSDPIATVRRSAVRQLYRLSKEYPALALGAVSEWHSSRYVRRRAMRACLRAASLSRDPAIAWRASSMLDDVERWSA